MDSTRWGWECMLQLQEVEDRKTPAATTWTAEFLLREGEAGSSSGCGSHPELFIKQRRDERRRLLRAHSHVGSGYT
jgi:hypothetical protein